MLWEILKASKGILVADFYADLWANIAGGGTPVDVFVEMIGTLPLYYDGKGIDLADYLISGNTLQDGTPSPDAPVDATGCGVRTGNLFDKSTVKNGYYIDDANGNMQYNAGYVGILSASDFIYIGGASHLYIVDQSSHRWGAFYDSAKAFISGFNGFGDKIVPNNAAYVRITVNNDNLDTMMLNLGSTALPYELYGFKLPLTVNGTEYPIYLGTVPTTRRIGKFDLSELSWTRISNGLWKTTGIPNIKYVSANTEVGDGIAEKYAIHAGAGMSTAPGYIAIDVSQVSVNTGDASETPTGMFWYVLAEPETAVVNEPLMRIGDYADTISAAQAQVTIPTVSGANVLDMNSPVKPSEVYIKGKGIKPTGYGQLADVNGVNILDKDGRPKGGN